MKTYTFWNNKGGTGKTSLCFQTSLQYAIEHPDEKVLVIDLCPQANISELFLGGMENSGSRNLSHLFLYNPHRKTIGGYFDARNHSPYTMSVGITPTDYLCQPTQCNAYIPQNLFLAAGDPFVEVLSNSMSALASIAVAGINTYVCIISWIRDFLDKLRDEYSVVFIDTNPSFAIYTQMAIAASDYLIIPLTADDSSIRAVNNILSLVYGIGVTSPIINSFNYQMQHVAHLPLPKIHMVIKNRLTQYVGTARAYNAVLQSINQLVAQLQHQYVNVLTPNFQTIDVRDFQSTGVVAYAHAKSFTQLVAGQNTIDGQPVQLAQNNIQNCINAMTPIIQGL